MDRLELLRVLEKRVSEDFLQISDEGAPFLFSQVRQNRYNWLVERQRP